MVDWRQFEALTDRVVIGANSEALQFTPMTTPRPNGRALPDPYRPAATIRGVLHAPEDTVSASPGREFRSRASTQGLQLVINRAVYPSLVVRQGDILAATERPDTEPMIVRSVSRYPSILVVDIEG